ncbi:MAG: efflux RND transporter periplasmic adaptor subunit [Victivallaceae bacterium]|nr:efflux RND transporter periplasmic adaptor subunit [Victivallaceae bacterium]
MKNRKKIIIGVLGGIVLLVLIAWQSGLFSGNKIVPGRVVGADDLLKDNEKLFTVKETAMPVIYKAVGTVHSRDSVDLAARIIARITEVKFREGDRVKKGDVLIRLDNTEYLAATAQAKEQVKAAQASLQAAGENVKSNQAILEFAKSENERNLKLFKEKIIAKKQAELTAANYNQALATWNQAIQAQSAASARLAAAKQELWKIETILAYATIKSPIGGVMNERLVEPGDLANPGKILLKIFNPTRLQLEVPVREGLVKKIKIGDKVPFYVGALQQNFIGQIKEIIPSVDPGSRTFLVKIIISNSGQLVPGMFGTLYLPLGEKPALLVPKQAITAIGQIETVEVVKNNRLQRSFIRTVPCNNPAMRQVISGLTNGQQILIK